MAATPSPAGVPDTIAGWKAVAGSLLTEVSCAFHRNLEISTQYAWIYKRAPACMKWAGMAAIASHHVRRALFPLRLDSDRTGYVDIPRSLGRHKSLLIRDVNTIRETNNAIFDDIFWVHLAYLSADDGLDRLRDLLRDEVHYAPVLSGFESIDRGRRVLEDATSTPTADSWPSSSSGTGMSSSSSTSSAPSCNHSSTTCRALSPGSSRWAPPRPSRCAGCGRKLAYFTSFYVSSLATRIPHAFRAKGWPRITDYDDRWSWIVTSVVPRFRRLDAHLPLIDASLRRIFDEGRVYSSMPCVVPHLPLTDPALAVADLCCPNAQTYRPQPA